MMQLRQNLKITTSGNILYFSKFPPIKNGFDAYTYIPAKLEMVRLNDYDLKASITDNSLL